MTFRCPECGAKVKLEPSTDLYRDVRCARCKGKDAADWDEGDELANRVEGPDEETWPDKMVRLDKDACRRKLSGRKP